MTKNVLNENELNELIELVLSICPDNYKGVAKVILKRGIIPENNNGLLVPKIRTLSHKIYWLCMKWDI